MVPRGFYADRTAGRFLKHGVTCLECDYTPESCIEAIEGYTVDLDSANEKAEACYRAYKEMFDWQGEAEKVKRWLETVG